MSAVGEKAVQAQSGIADLESALEKTQRALHSVEKLDEVAHEATRRGSKVLKLLLAATVVGVTILVARKLMGAGGMTPPSTDPFGTSSTEV